MDAKSHNDYLDDIGRTTETWNSFGDKRWNRFYFRVHKTIVDRMLGGIGEGLTVLDLGTSYGQWHDYLRQKGFDKVLGVEVDPRRAEIASTRGYEEVFATDGADVPLPKESVDVIVCNGVFVHIIRLEDKIAVLQEVQRLLKPGGTFVFSHTMSKAHGYDSYQVVTYMSFLRLSELVNLIRENTSFAIEDIAPTYFGFRKTRPSLLTWLSRKAMRFPIPFLGNLLFLLTTFHARQFSLEEADAVYLKLRSPRQN